LKKEIAFFILITRRAARRKSQQFTTAHVHAEWQLATQALTYRP
jgi:hypothetical protein